MGFEVFSRREFPPETVSDPTAMVAEWSAVIGTEIDNLRWDHDLKQVLRSQVDKVSAHIANDGFWTTPLRYVVKARKMGNLPACSPMGKWWPSVGR